MSFDPEFVREVLNDENDIESFDYVEDLRSRYSHAPVFDHAMNLQVQFLQTRLEKKDLLTAWNASQESLRSLEMEASEAGLFGETVTLRGRGIEVPKFETDFSADISMLTIVNSKEIDEKSLERYYYADEVKGIFSGFTLKFQKDADDNYIPKLAYQVAVDVVDIPSAHINLYATGIVGQSQVHFEDDEKLDAVAPILERLFTLSEDKSADINFLNLALSRPKQHDAATLRRVSHRAEKIVNSVEPTIAAQVEDGIIDLIGHYIIKGEAYYVKTPHFSLSAEEPSGRALYYGGDELHTVSGIASGMIFMPQSDVKDGEVVFQDRQTLHLVLMHEGRHLYAPLTRAQEFTKV